MNKFLARIKTKFSEEDIRFIRYAAEFADEKHGNQKRASGEPYVQHPFHVAEILVDMGMDAICVSAAILHDVLEDTECTEAEFKKKFGQEVYGLVSGVTKLSRINYTSAEEEQAENYRKLFFAIVQDIRVIFIKLADRLHNMRTLESLTPDKRVRISVETIELYAPLAGRLGIANIKSELEDLSMKYLYPEEYEYLVNAIDKTRGERMGFVMRIANEIEVALNEMNIEGEVKGRPKHLYSIFKKMKNQNKALEQIYDIIAVRVVVNSIRDCYTVLGIIHSKWKPVPGRFKDYIATPKPNLYQSLHTTVVTNFGQTFEIQIRTHEMNKIAEYGIAAHWIYKESKENKDAKDDKRKAVEDKLNWLKEVIEVDEIIKDGHDFISNIKYNISTHEIYVFTPKGAVMNLPKGSTCVDFAYKVHSVVGNKCSGAKVNNKMVPLNTVLENGDIIEIMTTSSKGPSRDWLKFVVSAQAKSKIRAFFKKEMQTENIKTGKDMLEREAKRRGYNLGDLVNIPAGIERIMQRYSLTSIEEMYASVGYGGLTTNQIILKLIDSLQKEQALKHIEIPSIPEEAEETHKSKRRSSNDVIIEGHSDFLIKLSRCCNPVPGDSIVGYAARGTGVSVHRADCPNIRNMETERLLKAHWAGGDSAVFATRLKIESVDKNGLLSQIIAVISSNGYAITSMEAHTKHSQGTAVITLGIQIKNTAEMDFIIKKLEALPEIISVKRNN